MKEATVILIARAKAILYCAGAMIRYLRPMYECVQYDSASNIVAVFVSRDNKSPIIPEKYFFGRPIKFLLPADPEDPAAGGRAYLAWMKEAKERDEQHREALRKNPDGGNFYLPHVIFVHSGKYWRCEHGNNLFLAIACFGCLVKHPNLAFNMYARYVRERLPTWRSAKK